MKSERLTVVETPNKRALEIEKARAPRNNFVEIQWNGRASTQIEDIHQFFFKYVQSLRTDHVIRKAIEKSSSDVCQALRMK